MSIAGSVPTKDCVCVYLFAVTCSVPLLTLNLGTLSCHSQTKIGKLALEYSGQNPNLFRGKCVEPNCFVAPLHAWSKCCLTCDSHSQDRYHISRHQIADATETALQELDLPHPMQRPVGAPVKKELCTSPDCPSDQWRTAPGEVTIWPMFLRINQSKEVYGRIQTSTNSTLSSW